MPFKEGLMSKQANIIVQNKDDIHDLRILLDDLNALAREHNIQGAVKTYRTLCNCVELYFNVLNEGLTEEEKKSKT
jgi:uncharacterized protein (DUF342 family)